MPYTREIPQKAKDLIEKYSSQLQLQPETVSTAEKFYQDALNAGLIRGRSIDALVVASLDVACIKEGEPYILKDITSISARNGRDEKRIYKDANRIYSLVFLRDLGLDLPKRSAVIFIKRFGKELSLPEEIISRAIEYVNKVESHPLFGYYYGNPYFLAVSAIYKSVKGTEYQIPKENLAEKTNTSVPTITKYDKLITVAKAIIKPTKFRIERLTGEGFVDSIDTLFEEKLLVRKELSDDLIERIRRLQETFKGAYSPSYEEWIDEFGGEIDSEREIAEWETIAEAYKESLKDFPDKLEFRKEIFDVILWAATNPDDESILTYLKTKQLKPEDVKSLLRRYRSYHKET